MSSMSSFVSRISLHCQSYQLGCVHVPQAGLPALAKRQELNLAESILGVNPTTLGLLVYDIHELAPIVCPFLLSESAYGPLYLEGHLKFVLVGPSLLDFPVEAFANAFGPACHAGDGMIG